jgi:uncharacterized membrane protein YkoI
MSGTKGLWIALSLVFCAIALPVLADDNEFGKQQHGKHNHWHDDDDDDHDHDHEIARSALERGEIAPLEDVLAKVRKAVTGQIVNIKLERERGIWVYEIRVLSSNGSMLEVYVDARSKAILKIEGK